MTEQQERDALPLLPDAAFTYERRPAECEPVRVPAYTADQMHAYARAALAAKAVPADPCLVLWQAMNEAEKVGNRTDDKLVVEFLRRAGYHIAAAPAPEATPTWDNGEAPLVGGGLIRPGVVDYRERAAQAQQAEPHPDTQDAERYRWLRDRCRRTPEHWGGRWSIVIDGPCPKDGPSAEVVDAAIDAARGVKLAGIGAGSGGGNG